MLLKRSINELPPELILVIAEHLDPISRGLFSLVNRDYFQLLRHARLDYRSMKEYLHMLELQPRFTSMSLYACFTCLRLKHRNKFTESQFYGSHSKRDAQHCRYTRNCFLCWRKGGNRAPGSVLATKDGTANHVVCVKCEKLETSFCVECRCCGPCTQSSLHRQANPRELYCLPDLARRARVHGRIILYD